MERVIYKLLSESSEVAFRCADRIYPAFNSSDLDLNREDRLPAIVYTVQSAEAYNTVDNRSAESNNITIDIFSKDFFDAKLISEAVKRALHGYTGQIGPIAVRGITYLNSQDVPTDYPCYDRQLQFSAMNEAHLSTLPDEISNSLKLWIASDYHFPQVAGATGQIAEDRSGYGNHLEGTVTWDSGLILNTTHTLTATNCTMLMRGRDAFCVQADQQLSLDTSLSVNGETSSLTIPSTWAIYGMRISSATDWEVFVGNETETITGSGYGSFGSGVTGTLSDLLVFDTALSSQQIANVKTWLEAKYS